MSTGEEPSFDANLSERRRILMTMLDAVYVDPVGEKSIFSIQPKPAFRPLFEMATTREGSDVVLIKEPPQATNEPEATDSCSWWRRGRGGCSQSATHVGGPPTWHPRRRLYDLKGLHCLRYKKWGKTLPSGHNPLSGWF